MIRLVACDIDGTLLSGYGAEIPRELFAQIRRLARLGVRFCPASGRQLTSLRRLFAPLADELYYVCENGAVIFGPGRPGPVLSKLEMDRAQAIALCRDILAIPGCEVQISGEDRSYLCPRSEGIVTLMRDIVGNNVTILSSPEEVPEPIVKVAVYSPEGAQAAAPLLVPRWGRIFRAAISGGEWVDFNSTDKGSGLRRLCAALDIPLEDTAAFGDSFNDAPMLELAGRAYIKSTACPELLSRFENRCSDVAQTLAEII